MWLIYSHFSNQVPIDINLLGSQLGMLECDSSKFAIGLAREFNLTMNAGMLIPRPDIDMNQLMKTSKKLLRSWREEVKRREAGNY
jgi:hypothetical protein